MTDGRSRRQNPLRGDVAAAADRGTFNSRVTNRHLRPNGPKSRCLLATVGQPPRPGGY